MRFPLVQLRHLSAIPITSGLGEAGDPANDPDWPRYIRTTDIHSVRTLDPSKRVTLPPHIAKEATVERGDILMSSAGSIGKSYVHLVDEPACYAGYLSRWRLRRDRAVPEFMAYWTESTHYQDQVQSGAVRSTIDNFSASKYRAICAPTPSLREQRAIADYLDRETAQIDAFIAKNEELITLLTERRAATIDDSFDALEVPFTRLKHRAQIQTGVTLAGEGDLEDPEWPYLRVANVQVGRVDLQELKSIRVPAARARQSMLRAGDVLMTEGGDADKLGRGAFWSGEIAPMLHQNHVFAVRVGARLDPRFLMRWLDATPSRNYFEARAVQTTNLASTNKTVVANLPLPSVPIPAQRSLVARLDERLQSLDEERSAAELTISLARERRAALISAAVTGQIGVGAVT